MGDWGYKPYQTDEALSWYSDTFKNFDFKRVENTILNFDNKNEMHYEPLRCASFVLQKLCIPGIWVVNNNQLAPKELIAKAISILKKMSTIDNDNWTYLDMWDGEEEIAEALNEQIRELNERLKDWK